VATAFRTTRRGIIAELEAAERGLLRRLFEDVATMLEPVEPAEQDPLAAAVGLDEFAEPPHDAAVRRLLPDAVRDDDGEALEFRRLTERSLREDKVGTLRGSAVLLEAHHMVLAPAQGQMLARAFNDVRLVLAERLDIASDEDAERLHAIADLADAEDVESYLALVYNFVTWLQESLVQALLDGSQEASS
jgi:hypothetical protein